MSDIRSSFERLMALFRYRGLDPGSLLPGQGNTMEALLEAGNRVAADLENLARRQAELIETSTRELMGSAQAMTQPERFKDATQSNLRTLTNAADATMHHLGELTELLIAYNGEIVSALNRTVMASMGSLGQMADAGAGQPSPPPAAAPAAPASRKRARKATRPAAKAPKPAAARAPKPAAAKAPKPAAAKAPKPAAAAAPKPAAKARKATRRRKS
jgi:hypothetical protein